MANLDVYQMVTNKVMEQLEQGVCPWQRPWTGTAGTINYVTRKPYSLLNQILLGREGEWLTFNQCKQLGGTIKKGAKAGMVVFFTTYTKSKQKRTDEDGEEQQTTVTRFYDVPVLRYYHVFHVDDCEGIESKLDSKPAQGLQPVEAAEAIVKAYVGREDGLTFYCDEPSNRAYYDSCADTVVVPMLSQYAIVEEYYSTTFHELTYSTMKETRCNRRGAGFSRKSEEYSREELVAELGAAMLCTKSGLDCDKAFRNSVAYIQGWLRALKNDKKMIVWASSRAEKAAKYILNDNG